VSPDDLAGHVAVLNRWFAAFNSHDVDALCEMADPAVVVLPLGEAESIPPGTTYHGREGLRTLMSATFERFPLIQLHHEAPQANGNRITVDIEFLLDDGVSAPQIRAVRCDYRIADGLIRRILTSEHGRIPNSSERGRASTLSPREREVLSMLAGGRTITEIAGQLVLSPLTVRTHVRNAKDKLHARTTAHAVAIALDEQVLDV
jgi:DNA-binding NarL/FixJ family response regulator